MKLLEKLAAKNTDFYSRPPVTAVFLGDSVTHGVFEISMARNGGFDIILDQEAVYHARLKKMLAGVFPAAPLNGINAGISGDNVQRGLERLRQDVLAYSPDLVVVCYGLNDVHGGLEGLDLYRRGLEGILEQLRDHKVETLFMTPNMMNTYISPQLKDAAIIEAAAACAGLQNGGIMDRYMETARELCREEGIPVCDCYARWKRLEAAGADVTQLLSNSINHPTRDMHQLFASSLMEMLLFG